MAYSCLCQRIAKSSGVFDAIFPVFLWVLFEFYLAAISDRFLVMVIALDVHAQLGASRYVFWLMLSISISIRVITLDPT